MPIRFRVLELPRQRFTEGISLSEKELRDRDFFSSPTIYNVIDPSEFPLELNFFPKLLRPSRRVFFCPRFHIHARPQGWVWLDWFGDFSFTHSAAGAKVLNWVGSDGFWFWVSSPITFPSPVSPEPNPS